MGIVVMHAQNVLFFAQLRQIDRRSIHCLFIAKYYTSESETI